MPIGWCVGGAVRSQIREQSRNSRLTAVIQIPGTGRLAPTPDVSSLKTDGSSPPEELFDEVWKQLRQDLIREMKKRTLWSSPPSYLGVVGSSWDDGDVLEELLVDCYSFSLAERVKNLQSQMLEKKRPNIYGLVVRNVRNFLSERQRRADPIGYRVFQLLHRALSDAVDAGELHILTGDGRIRNDTVLGFDPQASPDPPGRDFDDRVKAWNDELLPELVTARSRTVTEVVGRWRRLVVGLQAAGVDAFRFKDVIDPMKRDVRERWAGVWSRTVEVAPEPGDGEAPPETVLVAPPIDPIDAVDDLHRCVVRSIDRLHEKPRTREDLWTLWAFVRATHDRDDEAKLPSHSKLGKRLGIYRGRLPRLFEILQRIVEACRSGRQAEPALRSEAAWTHDLPTPRSLPKGERREAS